MGILSRVGRLALGARRGGARTLGAEARQSADLIDALSNYLIIAGGAGGLGGMAVGGAQEQSEGGTPDQINEAAAAAGLTGAGMGAATFGPALGLALGTNGVGGGLGILPYVLSTGSSGRRPRLDRERREMEEEAIRRAIDQRLRQSHRYD